MPTPEYNLSKKGYHENILIRRSLLMFEKKKKWYGLLLHKLCQNTGFRRPLFSCMRTKSLIPSLYEKMRVRENRYSGIFYVLSWNILRIFFTDVSDWTTRKDYICASPLEVFFVQYFERNWHWQWSGSFL